MVHQGKHEGTPTCLWREPTHPHLLKSRRCTEQHILLPRVLGHRLPGPGCLATPCSTARQLRSAHSDSRPTLTCSKAMGRLRNAGVARAKGWCSDSESKWQTLHLHRLVDARPCTEPCSRSQAHEFWVGCMHDSAEKHASRQNLQQDKSRLADYS